MDKWPQATVASLVIILVGAIAVTAIVRYATVDDALKFWSALSGLVGIITGAMVTYFFSRGTVQTATDAARNSTELAKRSSDAAQASAADARNHANDAKAARAKLAATNQALTVFGNQLDPAKLTELTEDYPAVKEALLPS